MHILTKIIKGKIPCYFISPHLDDAILSAGGLISYLAGKTDVEIITVFTEASPRPYTRFCNNFKKAFGFSDADVFFRERKSEDMQVCKSVGVRHKYLGYIDVAWRKKRNPNYVEKTLGSLIPEFLHLYPLGRNFMSGKIVEEDKLMISDIKKTISNLQPPISKNIPEPTNNYQLTANDLMIFSPLAIGNHVDHVIVRKVCREIFPPEKLIFWTDYPYINWAGKPKELVRNMKLKGFTWDKNLKKKRKLILGYKTQIPALFPKGLPKLPPEVYYVQS